MEGREGALTRRPTVASTVIDHEKSHCSFDQRVYISLTKNSKFTF